MNKRIGIIGGGQLGRMLALAAQKLGFYVTVLDPTPNSPASQVANAHITGSFKDKNKIFELANLSDYITFEIESANAEALEAICATGVPVNPSPQTLAIIKDKFNQKVFLTEHDIPVAPFALIRNEIECVHQAGIFGYPFLLKARFDAYDGRGNYVIKNKEDIPLAFKKLSKSMLYAEAFVPFIKELSVVSARGMDGEIISFPVVETIHKNNICHIVRSPAPIPNSVTAKAKDIAQHLLAKIGSVGVFAIEMFLKENEEIIVNEIAPRVHNSGHHTIEAFKMSQFEAHIRAITGMPLAEPEALSHAAVMVNILGERKGKALIEAVDGDQNSNGTYVHIYGKHETQPKRKMGHVTVLANSLEEAEKKALEIRKSIEI